MKVSAQYAEEHFGDLASAATRGEEVEIEMSGKPPLVLVQLPTNAVPFKRASPRILGAGRGKMVVPSWEGWKAMDNETEREMLDAPFITTREN